MPGDRIANFRRYCDNCIMAICLGSWMWAFVSIKQMRRLNRIVVAANGVLCQESVKNCAASNCGLANLPMIN